LAATAFGALSVTGGGRGRHQRGIPVSVSGVGSTGTVNIDGPGSSWTNNYLYVGRWGVGQL